MSVRGRGDLWPRLGIIRIILELHSQIRRSGPDVDIMRIIATSNQVRIILVPFRFSA